MLNIPVNGTMVSGGCFQPYRVGIMDNPMKYRIYNWCLGILFVPACRSKWEQKLMNAFFLLYLPLFPAVWDWTFMISLQPVN